MLDKSITQQKPRIWAHKWWPSTGVQQRHISRNHSSLTTSGPRIFPSRCPHRKQAFQGSALKDCSRLFASHAIILCLKAPLN
jgi:hypothetical protein